MKEISSIFRHIPNALTLSNVILGCLAISKAFERDLILASLLVFLAAVIDFLDGFLARRLNASSEFGKSLDSLADMVNFGIVPAFLLYQLLIMSLIMNNASFSLESLSFIDSIVLYVGFLIPAFAAARLARFNTSKKEGKFFQGLPTPAAGILIASITLLFAQTENEMIRNIIINRTFLVILSLAISFLMVSNLKLISLKFEDFSFSKENQLRYLFITASIALIVVLKFVGLPLIIIIYLLLSLLSNLIRK